MFTIYLYIYFFFFFFKQKTAYEIVDCDWSSDVCSSDLIYFYLNIFLYRNIALPEKFCKKKIFTRILQMYISTSVYIVLPEKFHKNIFITQKFYKNIVRQKYISTSKILQIYIGLQIYISVNKIVLTLQIYISTRKSLQKYSSTVIYFYNYKWTRL